MRRRSILNLINIRDGKSILSLIGLFIFLWIIAKPIKTIGQNIYFYMGSGANSAYQIIPEAKNKLDKIITSEEIISKQSESISRLTIENSYLENKILEVKNLERLLGIKSNLSYKTYTARVIGRGGDNWHKQIIINKGKKHGVQTGNSVISTKGIIGQVVEVSNNSSIVQLISDPNFKLGCNIREKEIIGILSGKTNQIGLLHYIPLDTKLNTGDIVETSGISASAINPIYPKKYPVGVITKVGKKKSKASDLYVEVKLFENLNSLSNVLVFSPD